MQVTTCSVLLLALMLSVSTPDGARAGNHVAHSFRRPELCDTFHAENASLGDINRDGHEDVISGPFWYEGPRLEKQHEHHSARLYDPKGHPDNFLAFVHDLDRDAWPDNVIGGLPGKDASRFRDPQGKPGYRNGHVVVGNKKGSFVLFHETGAVSGDERRAERPRRPATTGLGATEAAANMDVPDGFRVTVAASEPDVRQPIQLAIDGRGRVWVAEGHTYPNRARGDEGADRILVFEDTDGDGTLDSRKVFLEGLNLVSGLEVGFGGVWVGAAPYLLFVPDADRDDVPDGPPKVLLDGWGYQDTHETLNSFTWGPDGWLYGCHGIFTHSRVGKPGAADEERVPLNAGVWRYHPTRHEFEVFAWGSSNPWGLDFNEHGHAFITACVIPHLYHVIQGARYQRQAGQHFQPHVYEDIKTIADHLHHGGKLWTASHNRLADELGGGHAHCGAMIYLGDSFPPQYRGRIFMNNIHGNRINVDLLERHGSGYVGRHGDDFLTANDRWYRGVDMSYGPDGSVWLIDWYDRQACHQRLQEAWDRTNGRIYRISYGTRRTPRIDVAKLDDRALVRMQLHPSEWHVRASRRVLQERGGNTKVHAALREILDSAREPRLRLRALWTLHVTGGLTGTIAAQLLGSPGTHELLRSWTIQLVCERGPLSSEVEAHLVELANESDSPLVRLYLASSLARLPDSPRSRVAIGLSGHAEDAGDRNLPLLLWYGVEPLVAGSPSFAISLVNHSRIPKLTRFVARRLAADVENLGPVMDLLTRAGDEDTRRMLLEEVSNAFRSHARLKMPRGWEQAYRRLSKSSDPVVRDLSTAVAVKFGDRRVFPELRSVAADREASLAKRRTALWVLLDGEDPDAQSVLIRLLDDAALRRDALRGLAAYDADVITDAILSRYARLDRDEKADAVNTLASRAASARRLLVAIADGAVPRKDVSAFTVRQISGFEDPGLDELLASSWGTIRATAGSQLAQIAAYRKRLTDDEIASADLLNGRDVFARACATCHALFGSGDTIAPDLTGSNRADLDYVLENVVDPSAVVGKDYQLSVVITRQGRLVSGLIRKRTSTAVTVRTVNEEVVVPTEDIVETRQETESMMPRGLFEKLTEVEVRDLVAYLQSPIQVPRRGTPVTFDPTTKRAPEALEGETMKTLGRPRGNPRPQDMSSFGRDRWSGNSQLWWTGATPDDVLDLELPVAVTGRYQIDVCMTKAVDYGVVQFRIDGKLIDGPLDLFNPGVASTGPLTLGTRELTAGRHRLSIEIVGANPKAVKGYMFGLDYVRLIGRD